MAAGKRVSIVFTEREAEDGGTRFEVTLEGARFVDLQAMTDEERREKLDPATFWAYETLVRGVIPLLHASGAYRSTEVRKKPS
jgi:hypothetical protein